MSVRNGVAFGVSGMRVFLFRGVRVAFALALQALERAALRQGVAEGGGGRRAVGLASGGALTSRLGVNVRHQGAEPPASFDRRPEAVSNAAPRWISRLAFSTRLARSSART